MMWFKAAVVTVISLAYFGITVDTASIDCPTPRSPENGQKFIYQGGMTVKYACDPGYTLDGEVFAYCKNNEWSSEAPKCLLNDDSSVLSSTKDSEAKEEATYSRPLFNWDPEENNATANNTSGMVQDEPRLHMVLYPERRRPVRIRTAAVRVQSATELEEEQQKRSKEEKPSVQPVSPSIIYVRKPLTPGKVVIQEDSLRRQYELAALHLAGDPDPDVAVVPLPRAAVSTDDKGGQSDEALRQMYIMAQDYRYPRQAVVDPNRSPVVLTLSESQIMWINSLHPDLRERYLKDLYNTRAKEAEEGARAQEFLRRYEDAYHLLYNRPYYVRQPLAMMTVDPVASYDYTCYQADSSGRATLIRPPRIPNSRVTFYRRKNRNSPYNDYLTAVYRCNPGFRLHDSRFAELHCSSRAWFGERPYCVPTGTSIGTDTGSLKPTVRSCSVNNGGCEQICFSYTNTAFMKCGCHGGFRIAPDLRSCIRTISTPPPVRRSCSIYNGGCSQICSSDDNGVFVKCACGEGFQLGHDGRTCVDINECLQDNFGCSHTCVNTRSSAVCSCPRGFVLSADRKTCQDVDECANERTNRCHHKCTNTIGGYTCSCLPGYLMLRNNTCVGCPKNSYMAEPGSCEECPPNSHTVGEGKASLEDCVCDNGYTGNPNEGIVCTDIDECEVENFGCVQDCVNTPGSAHCYCPVGYQLMSDQKTCVDIDECATKNGGCQIECHNTEGGFYCSCPEGYTSSTTDVYSCIDIDECSDKNGNCSHVCNNFRGGYYCSCDVGYRLDSSQKICTGVTCSQIAVPHHARLRCGSALEKRNDVPSSVTEFPYGTTCTFKCQPGFKLSFLPGSITCGEDGSWSGKKPECVALTCPSIEAPLNGNVTPPSCTTRGGEVLQKCYITCNSGFRLVGNPVFTCKRTLTWQPEEFPICQAVKVLPHVACLPDISIEMPVGKSSMEVEILPPTSNVDPEYVTVSPSWVNNGMVSFPAGTTDITYSARSPTAPKATAVCTRTVKIIDKEAPTVTDCPSTIFVDSAADSGESTLIQWQEPTFEDNVGVVSLTRTMEPNVSLGPGVHFVEYIAQDAEGNVANCVFSINVTDSGCKDPIGPLNGNSSCYDWMFGKICEPRCNPGHVFYFPDNAFYTCDSSGEWSPNDRIPDCTKYVSAHNSECLPGMEFRIHEETEEEICVECPSEMLWSNGTKTCVSMEVPLDDKDLHTEVSGHSN